MPAWKAAKAGDVSNGLAQGHDRLARFSSGRNLRQFLISGLAGSSNRCGPNEDFDGLFSAYEAEVGGDFTNEISSRR